jgi:hypothetical protein
VTVARSILWAELPLILRYPSDASVFNARSRRPNAMELGVDTEFKSQAGEFRALSEAGLFTDPIQV